MKKFSILLICITLISVVFAGCSFFEDTSITFANDNIVVVKGSTTSVSVIFTPADTDNKKLVWSSSDDTVATVSDGKVTGVSAGETTITAITEDGVKASCNVKVKDVEITKVSISSQSIGMKVGGKNQLTAKVYPAEASQEVEWQSSDPAIVYVDDDGNLNALKSGSATVSVTANNGKKASCLVKVSSSSKKSTSKNNNNNQTIVVVDPRTGNYSYSSSYIFPYSDYVKLSYSDVSGLSKDTIQMGINEIYARHGRKFNTASVAAYFESKSWYSVNPYYSDSMLNSTELANINFLSSYR